MRVTMVAMAWVGLLLLAACGGGSGGNGAVVGNVIIITTAELEPNDTTLTATPLPFGRAGIGDLPFVNEIDYWSITAQQDDVICVELYGIRMDQAGWDAGGNTPRVRLLGPPLGSVVELEHRYTNGWDNHWSNLQDYDIVCFRIPVTGTYFVCVDADNPAFVSGRYAVLVTKPDGFDDLQTEIEPLGFDGLNNTSAAAETIEPGVMHGFHNDDGSDYYKFEITEPTIVDFELCLYRNGIWRNDDDYTDPELQLYDADGVSTLQYNDDTCYYDPSISYKFTTPGTYFIEVSECCGNGDGPYFLTYKQRAHGTGLVDSEPNDVAGNANDVLYGQTVAGQVGVGDDDYFGFDGKAGDMIELVVWHESNGHQNAPGSVNPELLQIDGTTPLVSSTDNLGGLTTYNAILTETGKHFVQIGTNGLATPYCFQLRALVRGTNETEPNNLVVNAQNLDANLQRAASGFIAPGDEDLFSFGTTTNELVCIDIWSEFSSSGDGLSLGRSLQPQINIGFVLPEWVYDAPNSSEALGTKGCARPTMTCCFIAPGGGTATTTVSRQLGAPINPDDVYVIRRR